MSRFLLSILLGFIAAYLWDFFCSQVIKQTSFIILGYRLHHSIYGLVSILFGAVNRNQFLKQDELSLILNQIVTECIELKNKYVTGGEKMSVDYICVFSQSSQEYQRFLAAAEQIGKRVKETKTGPVFRFNAAHRTPAGDAKILKIREPDITRFQKGDVDFSTNYSGFKNEYGSLNGFSLIVRDNFEMLELKDNHFNVLVYFSSIPPSKLIEVEG
ncbi:MAG: hypothetical protein COY80_03300 [Candidatus Pacebacteria bacterium CG_4_10_14_0_8_um_filter_42_14]|nr:MAG: hypothetical protein COY80_03300 [Candidatus Pacebacteria bacterium CG_4_10_14_0_8_um_filter_42_14]